MSVESLQFVVGGAFDTAVAHRIRAELERLPADQPVTIDFTRAQIASICTLTMFFEALTRLPLRPLELRGLTDHHRAVLRYCGLDVEALGWTASGVGLAA